MTTIRSYTQEIRYTIGVIAILGSMITIGCSEDEAEPRPTIPNTPTASASTTTTQTTSSQTSDAEFKVGNVREVIPSEANTYASYNYRFNRWTIEEDRETLKDSIKSIFEVYTDVLPEKYLKPHLSNLYLYTGQTRVQGFVNKEGVTNTSKWIMGLNDFGFRAAPTRGYRFTIYVMIHEFFHIQSLRAGQLDSSVQDCNTQRYYEGCAKENAYIYQFYKKFWKGKSRPTNSSEFSEEDRKNFVTRYSRTNHVEDLAESFTYFVFQDKPESDQSVRDQKVLFFYDYSDMISLRSAIRAKFSNYDLQNDRLAGFNGKNGYTDAVELKECFLHHH